MLAPPQSGPFSTQRCLGQVTLYTNLTAKPVWDKEDRDGACRVAARKPGSRQGLQGQIPQPARADRRRHRRRHRRRNPKHRGRASSRTTRRQSRSASVPLRESIKTLEEQASLRARSIAACASRVGRARIERICEVRAAREPSPRATRGELPRGAREAAPARRAMKQMTRPSGAATGRPSTSDLAFHIRSHGVAEPKIVIPSGRVLPVK